MSWEKEININGLSICVHSHGTLRGEIVGFHVKDEETIKAIKDHDPRLLDTLLWAISPDAQDFYIGIWAEDSYWWDVHASNNEVVLNSLLLNKYVSEGAKICAREELAEIAQKSAKHSHTIRRRLEFQKERDHLVLALIERDGYKCAECGAYEELTIDHVIPISRGGSDDLNNLRFLCRSHNTEKGDRILN